MYFLPPLLSSGMATRAIPSLNENTYICVDRTREIFLANNSQLSPAIALSRLIKKACMRVRAASHLLHVETMQQAHHAVQPLRLRPFRSNALHFVRLSCHRDDILPG